MKADLVFEKGKAWLKIIPESEEQESDLLKLAGLLTGSTSLDHISAAKPKVELASHTWSGELTFAIH